MGRTNLIVDVPVKAKTPTLYATALMTHLFSDEEMREGCVEPKEFKQITMDGATTAAVTEKVWGEYVSVVCYM